MGILVHFCPLAHLLDFSGCFVVIFFSSYSLNAFQSDNDSNKADVLWYKYVWGPSHFNPYLRAQAKVTLSWAQNIHVLILDLERLKQVDKTVEKTTGSWKVGHYDTVVCQLPLHLLKHMGKNYV